MLRLPLGGSPVTVIAIEIAKLGARTRGRPVVAGRFDEMHRLAAAGKCVIISENLAGFRKLRLGDTIPLAAPSAVLELPVGGIVPDYSSPAGVVLLDLALYRRYWHDDSIDLLRVYLQPGVEPGAARRIILKRIGPGRRVFVFLNPDLRRYVMDVSRQWIGLTYVQIAVAVAVAVLGITNTLTLSITDRRRELAVLRAVGGVRSQIRCTVWMEAAAMGVMGAALGILLGAVNLYYELELLRRDIVGASLDYRFPTGIALIMLPAMVCVAVLSAIPPAEAAVRGSAAEALEDE